MLAASVGRTNCVVCVCVWLGDKTIVYGDLQ